MAIFVLQQNDFEKIPSIFLVCLTPYFCSDIGNPFFCLARLPLHDFRAIHGFVFTSDYHHLLLAYCFFLFVANLWQNRQHYALGFVTQKNSVGVTHLLVIGINSKKYCGRYFPIASLFFYGRNYQRSFSLFVVICQNQSLHSHDWH